MPLVRQATVAVHDGFGLSSALESPDNYDTHAVMGRYYWYVSLPFYPTLSRALLQVSSSKEGQPTDKSKVLFDMVSSIWVAPTAVLRGNS